MKHVDVLFDHGYKYYPSIDISIEDIRYHCPEDVIGHAVTCGRTQESHVESANAIVTYKTVSSLPLGCTRDEIDSFLKECDDGEIIELWFGTTAYFKAFRSFDDDAGWYWDTEWIVLPYIPNELNPTS